MWGRATNVPASLDRRRPKRRASDTTATFRRTERTKRALRGVDASVRVRSRFGECAAGCAPGGDGGADGGSAQARSASSARRTLRTAFLSLRLIERRASTVLSASAKATACSVVSRDRASASEITAESGRLNGWRMTDERGARRREPEHALASIELRHELSVAPDIVFSGSRIVTARGPVLRHCEFVAERSPDVDQLVSVTVGKGAFERSAVLASLGVRGVVLLESCLGAIGVESTVVVVDVVVRGRTPSPTFQCSTARSLLLRRARPRPGQQCPVQLKGESIRSRKCGGV
eukprot:5640949-Pleurochrysis_carterae.AAC.6